MRSSTVLVLVAACLALTQGAIAATPPAAAPKSAKAATNNAAVKPTAVESPETTAKRAACEKTWHAQTKHTGKHKAFIAACVAKG
jgi:hypothetical protein